MPTPRTSTRRLRQWLNLLRYPITGSLLAYLIWQAQPALIWQALRGTDLRLLLLAVLLQFGGIVLSAAKWSVILRARGHRLPLPWLLQSYLVGQFANNFLPTTIGGDALRAVQVQRRIGSLSQASASIFVERLTGFLALSAIAMLALLLLALKAGGLILTTSPFWLAVAVGFTVAALGAAVAAVAAPLLVRWLGGWLPPRLLAPLNKVAETLAAYFPQGQRLALVLGMSLAFQLLWVLIHQVCGWALGIQAPFLLYALMVPLSDMLGLLPIFLNNVGAREIVFTVYLTQIGVSEANALALAFLMFAVRLLVSLLGGVVLLLGGADMRLDLEPAACPAPAPDPTPTRSELPH